MAKKEEAQSKLRLRVRSYDHKLIDNSIKQIVDTAVRNGAEIVGPIPLPTEFKRYTVNRSTFVHKTAREQFELRVHNRIIDIVNPSQKIIESLSTLNLPSGVDIEIKMK
ncbi:MAG: 30S ribosomal protein S10 [Candidatus Wolfebacteria bacterium GW2011_GWE1_48_7]|uniref:Small ribosomal subunit protein uS10 n=2 Tax=Candidatus Wolfeibacteriota TaxID=1752735 RepID=A0A0G1U4J3_9BACT|nr:MAG: 30S ribosomal protein S10, small subunit ribosomal protein S10 [Candidatus Wolfebacteria bacterium GW2011_GWB1_47_1]KKU36571.1 MAG: 30S ribosomal protein S10 [Candidatus Wolfebacteria bacterium GW2011_GWC2_46_275]KKU41705.1 MAG: 30S ribosomal protein S10 [Candidatus Wolfebacteria bacterium GW2011_GWB2_46_69]KKU54001.1 MAG: 30S ribosomal protein S10 [Candidatus Wolfebacteria bacterium GW2011_GWC1_47_103]KKU58997.1 MAG: 30S ribosomal protein S10 [Candidatus Wolfebacteria bacterium GW2011_